MTLDDKVGKAPERMSMRDTLLVAGFLISAVGLTGYLMVYNQRYYPEAKEKCRGFEDTILLDEFDQSVYCCKRTIDSQNERGEYETTEHCKNISLK